MHLSGTCEVVSSHWEPQQPRFVVMHVNRSQHSASVLFPCPRALYAGIRRPGTPAETLHSLDTNTFMRPVYSATYKEQAVSVEAETVESRIRAEPAPEFAIIDAILVIAKHRWLIGTIVFGCMVLATLVSFLLPVKYTARATILPPGENQSITSAVLGSYMGSLSQLGTGNAVGMKDPNDMYVAILKSTTVAETICRAFDLMTVYKHATMADTIRELARHSRIVAGQDSIISVEVEDRDPKRAAAMVNRYFDELASLTTQFLHHNATQRRIFLQDELAKAKADLGRAESDFRRTQERTGLITVGDQAKAIIDSVTRLRADIAAKEVALQGMRSSFATPQNPDLVRLQGESEYMRDQLATMERKGQLGAGNVQVPTGKVPSAIQDYLENARQVKYFEVLVELISKQYELARLDEVNTISTVQLLDRATPPEKRSTPKRTLIVLLATLLSIFAGIAAAYVREYLDGVATHPAGYERLRQLRALFGRSGYGLKPASGS